MLITPTPHSISIAVATSPCREAKRNLWMTITDKLSPTAEVSYKSERALYVSLTIICALAKQGVSHVEGGTTAVTHSEDHGSTATHDVTTGIEVIYR